MTKVRDTIIVGLGATGLSCARFLASRGEEFTVVDTRRRPPGLKVLNSEFPDVEFIGGQLPEAILNSAQRLVLSPGVALQEPAIASAMERGVSWLSDIDLFCEQVTAPIVAITGSNAKSTVTTLLGEMAGQAGINAGVGGNIGVPVLDLLAQGARELYVLELSSFQLEITHGLRASAAVILNLSPDHMDRHENLDAYRQAKQRIFRGCKNIVNNLDDPQLPTLLDADARILNFGLSQPKDDSTFGILNHQGVPCLARGSQPLLPVGDLVIKGAHNVSNALAALALGEAVGLPMSAMLQALREFKGLPHRCQQIRERNGVTFYNDSKGTNVGAAVAALQGLGKNIGGRIVLIAGGVGKGADFSDLRSPVYQYCRAVVLLGEAARDIGNVLVGDGDAQLPVVFVASMAAAVADAAALALPGDAVLLSPACASFDMYENFQARGEDFIARVNAL